MQFVRRLVAKVARHSGKHYPRVGFYNWCGTCAGGQAVLVMGAVKYYIASRSGNVLSGSEMMKPLLELAAIAVLVFGFSSPGFAGHVGGGMVTIPHGTTVGPQTVSGPSTTTFTNNGTINGGSSPGVTATGSPPPTITNNGTITSTTQGVSVSGSSTSVTNTGTISVTNSTNGKANATGISQTSGP